MEVGASNRHENVKGNTLRSNTEIPSTVPPLLRRICHALSCYRQFVTKQGLYSTLVDSSHPEQIK